jgi:hypothetical protein
MVMTAKRKEPFILFLQAANDMPLLVERKISSRLCVELTKAAIHQHVEVPHPEFNNWLNNIQMQFDGVLRSLPSDYHNPQIINDFIFETGRRKIIFDVTIVFKLPRELKGLAEKDEFLESLIELGPTAVGNFILNSTTLTVDVAELG